MNYPIPIEIKLQKSSHCIAITFADGFQAKLSCEYLRVYSPSAEVRSHGQNEIKLIAGKKDINILQIEPVGNYAVKLVFDDGHQSGLFTWENLYDLSIKQKQYWQTYLHRLKQAKLSREK